MLVLTRKSKETLVIGDDIRVTVLEVNGDQVKLGIEAPREIRIYRQEVYDTIQEVNLLAAQSAEVNLAELQQLLLDPKPKTEPDSESKKLAEGDSV